MSENFTLARTKREWIRLTASKSCWSKTAAYRVPSLSCEIILLGLKVSVAVSISVSVYCFAGVLMGWCCWWW